MTSPCSFVHCGDPDGPLLIALHGVTDCAASLAGLPSMLPGYHVVLIDAPGHGLSPALDDVALQQPATAFAALYASIAETIATLCKRYGPAVLVGHSMGGAVATALAAERKELVRALIAEDPAYLSEAARTHYRTTQVPASLHTLRTSRRDPHLALQLNARLYPHWDEAERAGWLQGKILADERFVALGVVTPEQPWQELLAAVSAPTLVLTGDGADVILGPAGLEKIRRVRPATQVALIPGARHCVRRDRPGPYAHHVHRFLAGLGPAA